MKPVFLALLFTAELVAGDPARDARWQQDLSYLAAQLPKVHPNFYSLVPQAQFNQAVSSLNDAIPNLTDAAVMTGMAAIVALAHDGHTSLSLTQVNSSFHLLPVRVQWFNDGLFVTSASAAYARALGAKVLGIGDLSADDAYAAVVPIVSHENDIWVRAYSSNYLVNADILQALKIAPDNTSVHFAVQDLAGNQFSMDVAALDPGQAATLISLPDSAGGFTPLYRQNTGLNYWYTYVASAHLLYFAYNSCENMAGLPFAQFNAQLWAAFDSNPVTTVVVDLRNNLGGDSSVFNPFLTSLTQRAARLSGLRYEVIIGRRTYSSAILNAISMQQSAGAEPKLVGEPSGGSPNSYGEVGIMVLPNSQLSVNYSTRYFSFPQYPPGSMLPDVNVPLASADYFARHDPFLAAVLAGASTSAVGAAGGGSLAVVNAATFRADQPVAAGSLAAVFGDFPGVTAADSAGLPLANALGGAQVLVNGTAAPLVAVRDNQINFQVPAGTAAGVATVAVSSGGATVASGMAAVAAAAPGLFIDDLTDTARPAAALDENSQVLGASGVSPGTVIQLFGTGQGPTYPAIADGAAGAGQTLFQTQVFFGGEQAEIVYSGMPGLFPGFWQANVKVPDSAAVSGQVPVFVAIGGGASNGVTVQVNR